MGAAGDMLTAALADLTGNRESCEAKLNALGIPGVTFDLQSSAKCGIVGVHSDVRVNGVSEGEEHHHHDHHDHEHEHHHGHNHHHEHHHTSMHDIEHIIEDLSVPSKIKEDAIAIYKLIAAAESKAHGRPVEEIHFHEVGAMDAVADIVAVCYLMNEIAPDKVVVSPIHVGFGEVKCAHGTVPVPAPATAAILEGVPVSAGHIEGELCTPTGAALLKYYADEFGQMPEMSITGTGYGMGKKDFEQANCVRAMLGESFEDHADDTPDRIAELKCNLDDMTGEDIAYATGVLMDAGALDVFTTAIGMKKGRPGIMLTVLCRTGDKDKFAKLIFENTTTIGIRYLEESRYIMKRSEDTARSKFGDVRMKVSEGYGVTRAKPEYEDIKKIVGKS
ncbi:MAG: nickel pincer cofactor biosynthesis protein LarC [Clostridiales bacterium]|nr:nickel pincer cofactor biosynthesis protein LarC [Clostridiales bacterium]